MQAFIRRDAHSGQLCSLGDEWKIRQQFCHDCCQTSTRNPAWTERACMSANQHRAQREANDSISLYSCGELSSCWIEVVFNTPRCSSIQCSIHTRTDVKSQWRQQFGPFLPGIITCEQTTRRMSGPKLQLRRNGCSSNVFIVEHSLALTQAACSGRAGPVSTTLAKLHLLKPQPAAGVNIRPAQPLTEITT